MPDFFFHVAVLASLASTFLIVGGVLVGIVLWAVGGIEALDVEEME